jgi:hypothetical protein
MLLAVQLQGSGTVRRTMNVKKGTSMDRTKLNLALHLLVSLKENLPVGDVEEKYVELFHQALSELAALKEIDLDPLRIPNRELKRLFTGVNRDPLAETVEELWSEGLYCDRAYFLTKLDASLTWFEFEDQYPEKRPIGFRSPD